jgi:hypothetical protein
MIPRIVAGIFTVFSLVGLAYTGRNMIKEDTKKLFDRIKR